MSIDVEDDAVACARHESSIRMPGRDVASRCRANHDLQKMGLANLDEAGQTFANTSRAKRSALAGLP